MLLQPHIVSIWYKIYSESDFSNDNIYLAIHIKLKLIFHLSIDYWMISPLRHQIYRTNENELKKPDGYFR